MAVAAAVVVLLALAVFFLWRLLGATDSVESGAGVTATTAAATTDNPPPPPTAQIEPTTTSTIPAPTVAGEEAYIAASSQIEALVTLDIDGTIVLSWDDPRFQGTEFYCPLYGTVDLALSRPNRCYDLHGDPFPEDQTQARDSTTAGG